MSLSRTVLVLESPAQIEPARARLGPLDRFRILATTPSVMHALDRLRIPYRIPEDYGTHEEVNHGLRENFVRLRAWCDEADRLLNERNSLVRLRNLRPASYHYQQIIRLLNPVWIKIYHLLRLIESEQPREIVFCTAGPNNLDPSYYFSEDDWLYASLLPLVAKGRYIKLRPIDCLRPPGARRSLPDLFRSTFQPAHRRVRGLARRLLSRFALHRDLAPADPERFPRTIWILYQGYDVGLLLEEFKRSGWRILYWPITNDVDDQSFYRPFWLSGLRDRDHGLDLPETMIGGHCWATECRQSWDALSGEPAIRSLFTFQEIDTFPLLNQRVASCFTDSLATVISYHACAEILFGRYRPDAILSPWTTLPALLGLFDLAKQVGVPTFVYQHGGARGYTAEKANFEDHAEGDYFLTYGDGVSRYVEMTPPFGRTRSAHPISVGSAMLDAMIRRFRASAATEPRNDGQKRPQRVLCVNWGYFVNRRYTPSYPATSYFLFEQQKLELLGAFPHVEVLLKPYPRAPEAEILRQIIAGKGWQHIKVLPDGQFYDWLQCADLLVLDYQGTPLIEALATAKPVILYLDERFQRLTPEAEKALSKRAMVVRTAEEFLAVLRERLTSGDFDELSDLDDEFLRLYGTHLNDGRSLERAYSALVTEAERLRR